jgi:hypothetical protein
MKCSNPLGAEIARMRIGRSDAIRVGHVPRQEDEVAPYKGELLTVKSHADTSTENVHGLVFSMMNMQRNIIGHLIFRTARRRR